MVISRRALVAGLIGASLSFASACGGSDSPSAPSTDSAPYSVTDLRVGTGATATTGRAITVNYAGWLYSSTGPDNKGTQFDSGGPYPVTLGVSNVIQGWHVGIVGMQVGGLRRLVLPPELAYGSAGNLPQIPRNATLVFEIELLSVQ